MSDESLGTAAALDGGYYVAAQRETTLWDFDLDTAIFSARTSIQFDGIQSYLLADGWIPVGNQAFTVCAWVYVDTNQNGGIVGETPSGDENWLLARDSGNLIFWCKDAVGAQHTATGGALATGAWHFVLAYHDPDNDVIGVQIDTGSRSTAANDAGLQGDFEGTGSDTGLYSGRYGVNGTTTFAGRIQNILLWKGRVLTKAQADWLVDNKPNCGELLSSTDEDCPGVAGLTGHWPMTEMDGDIHDISGNDCHFVRSSSPKAAGPFLAANTEYLTNASVSIATAYPFSMVVKAKNSDVSQSVGIMGIAADAGTQGQYLYLVSGLLRAYSNDTTGGGSKYAQSAGTVNNDEWFVATGVWSGAASRIIYHNDAAGVENTDSVTINSTYNRTTLGSRTYTSNIFNNGQIDTAMAFNIALTSAQRSWIYNSGSLRTLHELRYSRHANNPGVANLRAYWNCNEASNSNRADSLGNINLTDVNTVPSSTGSTLHTPSVNDGTVETTCTAVAIDPIYSAVSADGAITLSQSTLLNRPRLTSGGGGRSVIDFLRRNSERLSSSAFTVEDPQPTTWIIVARTDNATTQQVISDGIVNTKRQSLEVNSSTAYLNAGSLIATAQSVSAGAWQVWAAVYDGASSLLYKDGVVAAAVNAGTNVLSGITLGSAYDGSLPWDGRIAEIRLYRTALGSFRIGQISTELLVKYGSLE